MNETTFAAFIIIAAIGLFFTSFEKKQKDELEFPEVDSKPVIKELLKQDKKKVSQKPNCKRRGIIQ